MSAELSEMILRMAGDIGQASLDRIAGSSACVAELDQHVAAVVAALASAGQAGSGQQRDWSWLLESRPDDLPTVAALLHYACGFLEAAIAAGWQPSVPAELPLDPEAMRLAAVCQLVSQAQEASGMHPDVQAQG
jgi:hypothetical protein